MTKGQLREMAGISTRVLAKMGRGEDVNSDVLTKICAALNCTLPGIVEIVPDRLEERQSGVGVNGEWRRDS